MITGTHPSVMMTYWMFYQCKTLSTMLAIVLMMIVATRTTISVKQETKEILKELGTKGQTYDEIIRMLVERVSIKELDKRWNRILEEEEFTELDEKLKEGIYEHYLEKKKHEAGD